MDAVFFFDEMTECLVGSASRSWKIVFPVVRPEKGLWVMNYEEIRVECYSGYKANERPVAFFHQGRRWQVREIVDRWCEGSPDGARPEVDYFKVRTVEGRVFLLRHLSLFDAWSVHVP